MAKRAKKTKRLKRPAAQRWTDEERKAWIAFLKGQMMFPPGNRSLAVVVKQLRGWRGKGKRRGPDVLPSFDALNSWTRHHASTMAVAWLSGMPHRRENQIREQAEAICRIASGDIAFMVETPEDRSRQPEKLTLFEDAHGAPKRSAIHDLSDDILHAGIQHVRNEIARSIAARRGRSHASNDEAA